MEGGRIIHRAAQETDDAANSAYIDAIVMAR
jgi:hypothetical protein